MSELMTVKEVAAVFRVAPWTVTRWFHSGALVGIQVGRAIRFERSDVDALRAASSNAAS